MMKQEPLARFVSVATITVVFALASLTVWLSLQPLHDVRTMVLLYLLASAAWLGAALTAMWRMPLVADPLNAFAAVLTAAGTMASVDGAWRLLLG